jgi:hypothetical protein
MAEAASEKVSARIFPTLRFAFSSVKVVRHTVGLWMAVEMGKSLEVQGVKPAEKYFARLRFPSAAKADVDSMRFTARLEAAPFQNGAHETEFFRRGILLNRGIVPPRDANLRALSRSMRALSACRSTAASSAMPVNSCAVRMSSSSSATVILIEAL